MDDSQSGRDEYSTTSGISFPSLNKFISQEADDIVNSTSTARGDTTNAKPWIDGDTMNTNSTTQNYFDSYDYDDTDDDGYPTDEYTINSWAQSRGKESKRLNFLQLARDRLAARGNTDEPQNCIITPDGDDDDSFLANVDMEDIETAPKKTSFLANDSDDDFLTNVQVEDVEQQSDDSSFLAHAGIVDTSAKPQLPGHRSDETVADSCYNMYASTLSKADSTNAATLGDLVSRESPMAGEVENQSIDTYSYNRAYIDNVTLGESNFTSNCSALTDDYCYDARKVGMADAIKANIIHEGGSYGDGSKGTLSAVVESPSGAEATVAESDHSLIDSLPAPPPRESSQTDDFTTYENVANLVRIVSLGEGSGYVDEEAAMRYAATNRGYCQLNCGWFASSSRLVKVVVLCSTLMFLGSITSLALAIFWPDLINGGGNESSMSSRWDEAANAVDEQNQDEVQSILIVDGCYDNAQCSEEGARCTDGSTESCCGETYNLFVCDCINVEGALQYQCTTTNVCVDLLCDDLVPDVSTASLSVPTNEPSQFVLFTEAPSNLPSPKPTNLPTLKPSRIPSREPTAEPTIHPTQQSFDTTMTEQIPTVNPISVALSQISDFMQTVTVPVTKDTYVAESDAFTNFGTAERLRVDDSPTCLSIVTFDASAAIDDYTQIQRMSRSASRNEPRTMQVLTVKHAKLRLYSLDEGGDAIITVLPNAKRWTETSLTWNSMVKLNRSDALQVGTLDWAQSFDWNEVDVTNAFAMNNNPNVVISFMIQTTSYNGITFASRERDDGMFSPELVITLDSADVSEANIFHSSAIVPSPTPPPSLSWPTYSPTSIDD